MAAYAAVVGDAAGKGVGRPVAVVAAPPVSRNRRPRTRPNPDRDNPLTTDTR